VSKTCVILVVDDSPDDVFLIGVAFKKIGVAGKLMAVSNEREACQYLEGAGSYHNREENPLPDIVISDAMLGTTSGLDLLAWFRKEPKFRDVPFILYSGTISPTDAQRAVALGATAYLEKSGDTTQTKRQLREIISHLPEHCRQEWLKDA
jgi:CheY-like chemotaxis protein